VTNPNEHASGRARAPIFMPLRPARRPLLIALALSASHANAADQAIEGARGIVAAIDQKSGRYGYEAGN